MTHPAPNSELTAESVKLLKAGDVVLFPGSTMKTKRGLSASPARFARVDRLTDTHVKFDDGGGWALSNPEPWDIFFIGRSDADGWIPHDGGPNPVPGCVVDVRFADDVVQDRIESGFWDMGAESWWKHEAADKTCDIIAFRLAAPSVEPEANAEAYDAAVAEPDVAGARERLLGCADDDERHWSLDPREGWAVDVPVADLRIILSAYDRQGEENERLRGACDTAHTALVGCSEYLDPLIDADGDSEGFYPNKEMVLQQEADRAIEAIERRLAARARQGGPDHG